MKLIISDLDGTMIHRSEYSKKTLETVEKLKNTKHTFTIATGRHLNATRNIVKTFGIKHPVICSNGAVIYDFNEEKVLFQRSLSIDTAFKIIDICESLNIGYLIYTTKIIYAGTQKAYEAFSSKVGTFNVTQLENEGMDSLVKQGMTKILVIEDNQDLLDQLKEKLNQFTDISFVQSQPSFLDIGHKDSNKGDALLRLKKMFNKDFEMTIAIGDQENDLKMIEVADIGIAIGSGHDHLKEKADFVTQTYDNDGFSFAMHQYILNK